MLENPRPKKIQPEIFQQLMFGQSLFDFGQICHVMLQITVRSQICNSMAALKHNIC